jgi:hypothetical protein
MTILLPLSERGKPIHFDLPPHRPPANRAPAGLAAVARAPPGPRAAAVLDAATNHTQIE